MDFEKEPEFPDRRQRQGLKAPGELRLRAEVGRQDARKAHTNEERLLIKASDCAR